ncbi:hypothetical protein ABZ897_26475 [Nonomuraea sp. NPDC046802]|uniref:hypothetical protein n=1 Tax=Nonomuraea sp. NPDC046802 TaxID=3154919 RepID=UPI0033E3A9DA
MSTPTPYLSRRQLLATGAGIVSAVTVAGLEAPAAAEARLSAGTTENGWPVIRDTEEYRVEGSNASVRLLQGDAALVLLYVARRFHYEIDALRSDVPNEITGHAPIPAAAQPYESNYASGTAIAIRPNVYPRSVSGGFFPHELIVIRDILAQCDGVVRWGGDELVPKESHFQIDLPPADPRVSRLSIKIGSWNRTPGMGAGAQDPFRPERIKTARQLEQQQRGH